MYFCKLNYKLIQAENPTFTFKELSSLTQKRFKNLKDDEKQKYKMMEAEDRKRYIREVEEINSQGYFVNGEGVKSSEFVRRLTRGERKAQIMNIK